MRLPRAEFAPPNSTASSTDVIYRLVQRVPTNARSKQMPVPKQEQILLDSGQRAVNPCLTKVNGPSEAGPVTVNRTTPRPGRSCDALSLSYSVSAALVNWVVGSLHQSLGVPRAALLRVNDRPQAMRDRTAQ